MVTASQTAWAGTSAWQQLSSHQMQRLRWVWGGSALRLSRVVSHIFSVLSHDHPCGPGRIWATVQHAPCWCVALSACMLGALHPCVIHSLPHIGSVPLLPSSSPSPLYCIIFLHPHCSNVPCPLPSRSFLHHDILPLVSPLCRTMMSPSVLQTSFRGV